MMKRFDCETEYQAGCMTEYDDGEYVLFVDVVSWISVDDRLPEVGVSVWCFCFEDHQQRGRYIDSKDWGDEGMSHHFKNDYESFLMVTHWMQLPDDPK